MTEEWRVKRYYTPRVLVETDAVLDPLSDDILVCLKASHLAILRPLLQYAHRRATFVSEYRAIDYLAPTTEEWDELQEVVAELEDTLMAGCEGIEEQLSAIAAAVQCLCSQATKLPMYTPATQVIVDQYVQSGKLVLEDDAGPDTVVFDERCAIAQLTYQGAYEFLTEIVQPLESGAMDLILPAALVVVASWLGTPVLGIPTGLLLAVLWEIFEVWAEGQMADIVNAMESGKQALVCAIYNGLATDKQAAQEAAQAVVESWELPVLDSAILYKLFAPWMITQAETAYDDASAWALANVTPNYCLTCEYVPPLPYTVHWYFPPCPQGWTGTAVCYTYQDFSKLSVNGNLTGYSPVWYWSPNSTLDVVLQCYWYSVFGSGWTVGYLALQYSADGVTGWSTVCSITLTTTVASGTRNELATEFEDRTINTGYYRLALWGQAGQGGSDPYPVMASRCRFTFKAPD